MFAFLGLVGVVCSDVLHWNTLLSFIVSTAIIAVIMVWRELKEDE